jgi:rhomboid protease GluP
MCRNCGALVGANETSCSACGATKDSTGTVARADAPQPQAQTPVYDHETVRFARAILSRPYIFTIIFLVANIFVFILTAQAGADNNPAVLIKFGAKVNSYINSQHEWWRFVTPIFLHGGIAHILMNMYGLWVIGPYVERLYGSAKFVVFWVATGVAGVVASYLSVQPGLHNADPIGRFLFKAQDSISVGASGALFGLIGVLFVFGIKFRRELPEGFKRAFGTGMLPTILLNIFIGVMVPVIDNAAHMGGLVAGALLALVVDYKRPGESKGIAVFWHVLQVAALALVVVSFVMVARHFDDPKYKHVEQAARGQLENDRVLPVQSFLQAIYAGDEAFVRAFNDGNTGNIKNALEALDKAPHLDDRTEVLRNELKALLTRVKEFAEAQPANQKPSQAPAKERDPLLNDFKAWRKQVEAWIKTDGQKYGNEPADSSQSNPDSTSSK